MFGDGWFNAVMNLAVTAASSIAVAAVFAAADGSLTRDLIESKVTSIVDSLPEPLDPVSSLHCYYNWNMH